jgi:hypothetical protein
MSRMMTPDDYATSAESVLDRVMHGDSNDPATDAEVAGAYALLAVASSLAQIAERLEST